MAYTAYQQSLGPYGKVYRTMLFDPLFKDPNVSRLSQVCILALLASPECSNLFGCFTVDLNSMAINLGSTVEETRTSLEELQRLDHFLFFDPVTHHVIIKKFLKWNPLSNPRMASKALMDLGALRLRGGPLYGKMLRVLEEQLRTLGDVIPPPVAKKIEEMIDEYLVEHPEEEEVKAAEAHTEVQPLPG